MCSGCDLVELTRVAGQMEDLMIGAKEGDSFRCTGYLIETCGPKAVQDLVARYAAEFHPDMRHTITVDGFKLTWIAAPLKA